MENNNPILTDNDKARKKFIDAGLSYKNIGSKEFYLLVNILTDELAKYTDKDGVILPMTISKKPKRNAPVINFDAEGCLKNAFIKVDSFYFDGREAISFNQMNLKNEFWIGFAGWADSDNVKPFTTAFEKWVDKLLEVQV